MVSSASGQPTLHIDDAGTSPQAIALVLHGGASQSLAPVPVTSTAYLRMVPFSWSLQRAARGRLVIARLRNRVRGWNGAEQSSVHDARWAVAQLRERFGALPVGLVGHSLGGRTALRVAGEAGVRSIAALAPWLPPGEPYRQVAGRRVLLVHGTADRITSNAATALYAARLRQLGTDVTHLQVPGGHSMLRGFGEWHRLATEFTAASLLAQPAGEAQSAS
ncbi:MAG TPA: alpha/beta fold hydrolase [Dermatophilaceae bacterium]|nr:alpha/beta fold hydrolase [Dermatophilaceae bacterium]